MSEYIAEEVPKKVVVKKHHPLYEIITSIVGTDDVVDDPSLLWAYSLDASPTEPHPPEMAVQPESTEEIYRLVQVCNRTKTPIIPVGGRASLAGGGIPLVGGGISLDLNAKLNKIIDINEDKMCVTVQTGITWGELVHELRKKGFKLGFRGPHSGHSATVGGSLSHNSYGWGSAKNGQAGESCLNLEVVLPTGGIVRTGSSGFSTSERGFRYAGPPDICGMFLGDHGMFGVKTEATLKMYYWPEGEAYEIYALPDMESSVKAIHEIQARLLAEELILYCNRESIEAVIGKDFAPGYEFALLTVVEEDSPKLAESKIQLCDELVQKCGGKKDPLGPEVARKWWREWMFTTHPSVARHGIWIHACFQTPYYKWPELHKFFKERWVKEAEYFKDYNIFMYYFTLPTLGGWGSYAPSYYSHRWELESEAKEKMNQFWAEEIRTMMTLAKSVPYWFGLKVWEHTIQFMQPEVYRFLAGLKKAMDPNCVMYPGAWLIPLPVAP